MNPALVFVLLVVAVAILVTWWLLRALKRDRLRDAPDVRETNVEALRIERAELERDRKLGLMSDAAFDEAVRELEVRVLRESALDRATPHVVATKRSLFATVSFATLLPMAAVGMYFLIGAPHAVIPEIVRPPEAVQESQMEELFRVAEERLKATPDDAKGRYLLARARASVGQFDEAMKDYEKLVALTPNDADAWADFADAAAGAAQGKMAGKPLELVNKALAIDAKQPKALLLRGTHEIQNNALDAAEKTFTLAKSVSEPNTGFAQIAENALKDIAARRSGASASASANAPGVANAPALLSLRVTLSADAKQAATAKDAAVFAIVRAADATSGPPIAAKKLSPSALDKPIEINASDAMIGGAGLAPGSEVSLEVRLSVSGQPRAQAGDYASERVKIKLPSDGKALSRTVVIDKKID
jgi:cytochrome c-type biogenesis protein CcmH